MRPPVKQRYEAGEVHTSAIPNIELLCRTIGVRLDDYELAAQALF